MQAEDMILISVGDHVVEPPHLFQGLLPPRFADRAPEVITVGDGEDVWIFNGSVLPNNGLSTTAAVPTLNCGTEPSGFERMWPGCFDIDERIKDMNAAGILGSMCFPSFPGFAGRVFAAAADNELALSVTRAYNDWHIDQWCGSYPGRFIPTALPIIWDAELCAEEIRRVAAKGCKSMAFTENPSSLGCPGFHDEFWDPVWRALSDHGVVMSVHLGSSGPVPAGLPTTPADVMSALQPMNICQAAADLLWSRVIRHFPDVRFALSQGGTGWIPYFLDRIDRTYKMRRLWTGQQFMGKLPSEIFHERFLTYFTADPIGVKLRYDIGINSIAWQCDCTYGDSFWVTAAEELQDVTAGLPDSEIDKITFENACRWYAFEPFVRRPRQLSTVGALREEAVLCDISVMSLEQVRYDMSFGPGVSQMASRAKG